MTQQKESRKRQTWLFPISLPQVCPEMKTKNYGFRKAEKTIGAMGSYKKVVDTVTTGKSVED